MPEQGDIPPPPRTKRAIPRFLDKVRRTQGIDTETPTYRPENLDPTKIANFLGNWKSEQGMPGEWKFRYEAGKAWRIRLKHGYF